MHVIFPIEKVDKTNSIKEGEQHTWPKMSVWPVLSIVYSQHARENKNITNACRVFNLSRTIYFEWLRRFNQFGYLGLMVKERSLAAGAAAVVTHQVSGLKAEKEGSN